MSGNASPYKTQLDEQHAESFIKHVYRRTLPVKPHEAEFIRAILQTDCEQHGWRTAANVFCKGCGRETTVLDLFLSGLLHHSPKYVHDFLYNGGSGHGETTFRKEGLPTIEVYHHALRITCVQCGTPMIDHFAYFYQRPAPPLGMIAVSEEMFDYFHDLAKKDVSKGVPSKIALTFMQKP